MTDPLTQSEIERLRILGYHNSPLARDATNLAAQIAAMVETWQIEHASRIQQILSASMRLEPLRIDGVMGPATRQSLWEPRCGFPDFFDVNNPLMRAQAEAGSNAWPTSCRMDLTWAKRNVRLIGLTGEQIDEMYSECFQMWMADIDVSIREIPDFANANFQETSARLGNNGTLADHWVGYGECGAELTGRMNSDIRWSSYDYALSVVRHEIGHGLGLFHATGPGSDIALMRSSINQATVDRRGGLSPKDQQMLNAEGYVLRTAPPETPSGVLTGNGVLQGDMILDGVPYKAAVEGSLTLTPRG